MRYIKHLYLVLGNCTQVHLQCTWVVPKYISQNPVLVLLLVLEHFQCTCTCTQVLSRCTYPNPALTPRATSNNMRIQHTPISKLDSYSTRYAIAILCYAGNEMNGVLGHLYAHIG